MLFNIILLRCPIGSLIMIIFSSVQFSSVAQLYPTLCDPMDYGTSGLSVHRQLLEFTQTHVHGVGGTIQLSHPLLSPSPPAFNLSQHQGLFQWVSSLHQASPPPESLPWPSSLYRDCFLHNTSGPLELVGTFSAHRRYVHLLSALKDSEPAPPCQSSCPEDAWCLVGPWQICV